MKAYHAFDEHRFLRSVQDALDQVSKILDTEARPMRLLAADETDHSYSDKFSVAENLTTTLKQSVWTVLQESLGLTSEHQVLLDKWRKDKDAITIRFAAKDSCAFLKENEVKIKEGTITTEVKTTGGFLGGSSNKSRETTVHQTAKEYHWKVQVEYKLSMYQGNDVDGGITLKERSSETVIATKSKQPPLPPATVNPVTEAPLKWFLDPKFTIDRSVSDPITPRRNTQVEEAIGALNRLAGFAGNTNHFFVRRLQRSIMDKDQPIVPRAATTGGVLEIGTTGTIEGLSKEPTFNGKKVRVLKFTGDRYEVEFLDPTGKLPKTLALKTNNLVPDKAPTSGPSLNSIQDDTIVVPILPVLEDDATTTGTTALSEHTRSLRHAISDIEKWYPNARLVKLITSQEAVMVLTMLHLGTLAQRYKDAVSYIEATLRKQLVTAIGKEVDSKDFQSYMQYHYRSRLFGRDYHPTPFCRAVRRSGCFPDGTIALEQIVPGASNTPVSTWVRESAEGSSFYVPIHASASVELTGPKYLHGWMQHRFDQTGRDTPPTFQLACRARQFSSFLVILGTVSGPDSLDPQHAIVVQNKDELLIPLLADPLPSAKEFKDAIQSLSPEQQEFAKEFRSMQLSSSVFGVCVIQIKPQLEKLLGIPDKALTKEIQLTQDLMSLFVDYQVPSDMLTYDGPVDAPVTDKVAAVKEYTKSVLSVIEESKQKQLKDEAMRAEIDQAIETDQPKMRTEARMARVAGRTTRPQMAMAMAAPAFGAPPEAFSATRACAGALPEFSMESNMMHSLEAADTLANKSHEVNEQSSVLKKSSVFRKRSANVETPATTSEKPTGSDHPKDFVNSSFASGADIDDFTIIPKILDGKLERLDTDGSLRSTIVKAGQSWARHRQENLLTDAKTSTLHKTDIETEKKKAFDLLDAISRSGTLSIEHSELHVIIAVSHCFEKDVMATVIEDNVNPISKVERSALLLASTTFGVEAASLIKNQHDVERLSTSFPLLFGSSVEDE